MAELEQQYRARLDRDRAELEHRVMHLTDQISQLANANALLNTANSNLANTVASQSQEINDLKRLASPSNQSTAANQNMVNMIKELEEKNGALNNNVALLTKELNQLRSNGGADKDLQDAELRHVLLCIEIERLYLINSEFLEDINMLDEANQRLQRLLQGKEGVQELNDLATKFEHEKNNLISQLSQLKDLLQQKTDENNQLRRAIDGNSKKAPTLLSPTANDAQNFNFQKSRNDDAMSNHSVAKSQQSAAQRQQANPQFEDPYAHYH